ncbi:UNVERIFIED_CONTAM: hypothetical protein PYX00_007756 [Menopon gallinae]|uniref:Reverse transcriptase domain-containing protein n=1 Tax=Menopon gallinae TaxID=328185 RepID=A0AAW2HKF2_9NEOP
MSQANQKRKVRGRAIKIGQKESRKAPGWDLITGKVVRELSPKCLRILTIIYNSILRLGYFPSLWKVADIIMLPKPGKSPDQLTSYRPISLLPLFSKILEKLLLNRLNPLIEASHALPNHQFGFRHQHSTVEQVHRIARVITQSFEAKEYCSAAFLDISQAFDKVWHVGLLHKLHTLLPPYLYTLLHSYLSDRHFCVRHLGARTDLHPICSGVPQGSVLGPTLYLLFTSDIPTTPTTTIATFADDTALLASHPDPAVATARLQRHLDRLQLWLSKWRIRANDAKSVHVTFTLRRQTCPPLYLNGSIIPPATSVKYLGVHLDRRLTWKTHIQTKRAHCQTVLRQLYWLLGRHSSLPLPQKLLLYKAILKPIWTYGIQLWGSASSSNLEILERFQSKTLRLLTKAPWFVPNRVLHEDLGVPSIKAEIGRLTSSYSVRLEGHTNPLANSLLQELEDQRRLRRYKPLDSLTRYSS